MKGKVYLLADHHPGVSAAMQIMYAKATLLTFTILYILSSLTTETVAFKCYVCDSKDDIECTENLPRDSRLISQDCKNITGAKYCIKTTNIYAGKQRNLMAIEESFITQQRKIMTILTQQFAFVHQSQLHIRTNHRRVRNKKVLRR